MTHKSGFRGHEKFRAQLLRPRYITEVINIIHKRNIIHGNKKFGPKSVCWVSCSLNFFRGYKYAFSIFSQSHLSLFGKAMKVSKSTLALQIRSECLLMLALKTHFKSCIYSIYICIYLHHLSLCIKKFKCKLLSCTVVLHMITCMNEYRYLSN